MPFLMAGDPDLERTRAALLALQASGADLIELGIPYSDPLADGPVIQAAASRALASATTPGRVLEMLAGLKGELIVAAVQPEVALRDRPLPQARAPEANREPYRTQAPPKLVGYLPVLLERTQAVNEVIVEAVECHLPGSR